MDADSIAPSQEGVRVLTKVDPNDGAQWNRRDAEGAETTRSFLVGHRN